MYLTSQFGTHLESYIKKKETKIFKRKFILIFFQYQKI